MRALTYLGKSELAWRDVDRPTAGPTDAIVRPLAVARCDLDATMVNANLFPGPYVVGHEFVGEIDQVGDLVTNWKAGDRVIAPFQVSCGSCGPCHDRHFAACVPHRARAGSAFGFGPHGGGHGGAMADLLLVPHADHMLMSAPTDVAVEALASLGDNVVDAYRTVAIPLAERPNAEILIVGGAGESVGYYMIQWARLLGASSVRYADTSSVRCDIASSLGADVEHVAGDWPRRLSRAPITVVFTTDADALRTAIRSTEDYGYCMNPSVPLMPDLEVPMLDMYTKGITFHTSRADALRYLPEVIDFVADGRFDPLETPTTVVGNEDAAAAWVEPGTKLVVTTTTP